MSEIVFRPVAMPDATFLKQWLLDPQIMDYFPMINEGEIQDAVRIWMNYSLAGYGITAVINEIPCGMFNLYIQPFEKIKHNCLFSIIVDQAYRGQGIGTRLIEEGEKLAKEKNISLLHLEVYDGNPAQRLYEKMGFVVYGKEKHFVKKEGSYRGKILMEKTIR